MTHLPTPADVRQNRLLALLPKADLGRVRHNLQPVLLIAGEVLYEPGCILDCAYFPATAIVSLEYVIADGKSAEVAIVGSEGIVGIALFMGGESRPNRAVVQATGWAYRLKRHHLHEEFARGGALQHVLLLYTQARLTLTAQAVICNRHHTVDQQLCRWLLLSLDRAGLESRSCECYRVVKREYDRLLPVATLSGKAGLLACASRRRRGCLKLQAPEQEQHEHDDEQHADDSARAVTPAARVRPHRNDTNQRQDEENKKDRADAHGVHL